MMFETKRETLEHYIARMHGIARASFAKHEIVSRSEKSWLCMSDRLAYRFEVQVCSWGHVLIHGDMSPLLLTAGEYTKPFDQIDLLSRLGDGALEHRRETRGGAVLEHDHDDGVWLDRAIAFVETDLLEEAPGHLSHITTFKQLHTVLHTVLSGLKDVPEWLLHAAKDTGEPLMQNDVGAHKWGEVPPMSTIYAHEAIRRLSALLRKETAR